MLRNQKHAPLLASLWLACATAPTRDASADVFRYTDRSGRSHIISTAPSRPLAPTPLSSPPASSPHLAPERGAGGEGPSSEAPAPGQAAPSSAPYGSLARTAAEANALPTELVLAVIETESAFDPRAVSPKGALGLMQLMPATAEQLGVTDPFEPRQNVEGGAKLLRLLLDEFDGQLSLALAAYNAGSAVVRRHGAIPPIAETQGYVASVLRVYQRYLDETTTERGAEPSTPARFAPSAGPVARSARARPQHTPSRHRSTSPAAAPGRVRRRVDAKCPGQAPCRSTKPPR